MFKTNSSNSASVRNKTEVQNLRIWDPNSSDIVFYTRFLHPVSIAVFYSRSRYFRVQKMLRGATVQWTGRARGVGSGASPGTAWARGEFVRCAGCAGCTGHTCHDVMTPCTAFHMVPLVHAVLPFYKAQLVLLSFFNFAQLPHFVQTVTQTIPKEVGVSDCPSIPKRNR